MPQPNDSNITCNYSRHSLASVSVGAEIPGKISTTQNTSSTLETLTIFRSRGAIPVMLTLVNIAPVLRIAVNAGNTSKQ